MPGTSLNFRDSLDLPEWRILSQPASGASTTSALASGDVFAEDQRNNNYAHPTVIFATSTASLRQYNYKNDAWHEITGAFGAGGTFGTGNAAVFSPSLSPKGVLGAGHTTTKVVLSTALPASVAVNQLADRGDGLGFIIRIIGNASGASSGLIEERRVIANSSGTTPTLILDSALSFTPATGDAYEFLSGSYLLLTTGALVANQFRRYDCLTSSTSSLTTTGLLATIPATGNLLIALDEAYVPSDRTCGEGFIIGSGTYNGGLLRCLTATAVTGTTLTGQASGGDAAIVANQFVNYQIRIVEDAGTPAAVGQRRKIISHTSPGTSPVYTVAAWTTNPSATAKFVIENDTNNIMFVAGATSAVYNYNINTPAWSTAIWAARGHVLQVAGAFACHTFGVVADEMNYTSPSKIYFWKGSSIITVDVFDISTNTWALAVSMVDLSATAGYDTLSANDMNGFAYNPHTQGGKYAYIFPGLSSTTTTSQRSCARIHFPSLKIERMAGMRAIGGAVTNAGCRLSWCHLFQDASAKVAFYNCPRPSSGGTDFWQLLLHR